MTVGSILSNALTALQTSQAGLNTTSANIANINTPGYKRRVVEQEALQFGNTPSGVGVTDIKRVAATFLAREALSVTSDAARYDAESKIHDTLQSVFGAPDQNTSVSGKIDTLFASLQALSVDPTSATGRSSALGDLSNLANTYSNLFDQIQSTRRDTDQQIASTVTQANDYLQKIFDLNIQIQKLVVSGGDANGLKDQRDQAVQGLAQLMDIRTVDQANGKQFIMTPDGVPLATEVLQQLDYTPSGSVGSATIFNPITVKRVDPVTGTLTGPVVNLEPHLNSGTLRGLIDMRSKTLPDLARQLGELAGKTADALNAVHNSYSAVPPVTGMTGAQTGLLAADAHGFTGKATFTIIDSTGNLVRRVDVDFDANTYSVDGGAAVGFGGTTLGAAVSAINTGLGGAGTLTFTNGVMSFQAAGGNGVAIVPDSTTPATRGGHGFSQVFGLNDVLRSSVPSNFDTGLSASDANGFTPGQTVEFRLRGPNGETAIDYTYTISAGTIGQIVSDLNASGTGMGGYVSFALDPNGKLTATPTGTFQGYTLEVAQDLTSRGGTGVSLSELFGLGDQAQMNHAQGIALAPNVLNNPAALATARVDLQPTTVPGNSVLAVGDNQGISALAAVQDQVVSVDAAGSQGAIASTLGNYASGFLSNAATMASRSDAKRDETDALSQDINQRVQEVEGVNLDEELSNMIVYQQSYNAAARLITTSKELFDQLLQAIQQ